MIVLKFRKHLLHYGLAEKHWLGPHPELLALLGDGRHFAVIQIDDLPVSAHKRCLLLLQIFRIHS